ncbi:transposable element Tcb2 transposase [Trichonephila clavipes]|nr:transposable element Tcb2 transposase [Trichonephila clavipes]
MSVRALVPLQPRRIEGLIRVKSVDTQCSPVGLVWYFEEGGDTSLCDVIVTWPWLASGIATIKKHIRQFREDKPKSVERLDSSIYVDDLYFGAKDIYEAYELSREAVMVLKAAGMNLRKLNTNCEELKSMWIQQGLVRNDSGSNVRFKLEYG